MDGHGLLALLAPRPCAIATAWTDREGDSTLGTEVGARAAREVYSLLLGSAGAAAPALHVLHRPGDHHGFVDAHAYFDYFDVAFSRLAAPGFALGWAGQGAPPAAASPFAPTALTAGGGFSWAQWNESCEGGAPPPSAAAPLAERVAWLLQLQEPASGGALGALSTYAEEGSAGSSFRYNSVMVSSDYDDPVNDGGGIARMPVSIGDYLTANVYYPANFTASSAPLPAVIWLHPYSYATGYAAAYSQAQVVPALVRGSGALVVAFDLVGFGSRLRQGGTAFFARHGGRASPLGHMLRDVRAAVDALLCASAQPASGACWAGGDPGAAGALPPVDAARIYLAGFSLGGTVALHSAALDARVAGVAAFAAFTPFRSDLSSRATGGLRRLYELHAIVPRLGHYEGAEASVPYDYDELLAALAPRPLLLVTPQLDRDATLGDVVACAAAARRAWVASGSSARFNHTVTAGGSSMGEAEAALLVAWLRGALSKGPRAQQ
jgi:hypothetical protein